MESSKLRFFRWASMGVLAVTVASCGGGNSSTPTTTPTPTPAPTPLPPQIVAQDTGLALRAGWITWRPFPTSRAGILEATVDWTSADDNIGTFLIKGECDYDQVAAGQCETLVSADSAAKPETFTYQSTTASTYTIFIYNDGPDEESISYQVVLRATLSALDPAVASRAVPGRVGPGGSARLR